MQITVTVKGSQEVQKKLIRFASEINDLRQPMTEIGKQLSRYYANEAFGSQGGVFGSPWASLSMPYAAWKAHNFPGRGPLIKTGSGSSMQNSFTYEAGSQQVVIGNTKDYFKYHQSSRQPRMRLPRRQMIGVNSRVKEIATDIISEDIRRKLRAL